MRYEVVQHAGEWIVSRNDHELGRFADQERALRDVAERLRKADRSQPASLAVHYEHGA
ncbi:MAG TPA: hypothetical protein VF474_05600 [Phenylobacterium sp.]